MKKATYEDIKTKIEKEGCQLISTEYKSAKDKIVIKFPCGHLQETTYDRFRKIIDKSLCKKCKKIGGKTIKLTFEEVKKEIEKEGYSLLSNEYKNAHTLLKVECPEGHIYEVQWANWQQGYRCPYCGGTKKKEYEEVKSFIEEQGYILLSDTYINSDTYLEVSCGKHEPYLVRFSNFQRGKRCPHCIQSRGEKRVKEVLDNNNIKYIRQYKYEDCRDIKELPFDFYLPQYDICIEYDGRQHYDKTSFNMSEKDFETIVLHDNIKTNYCKDNNINLIRIPYWEFDNIESILITQIGNFND